MTSPWARLRRVDPRVWDGALALILLASAAGALFFVREWRSPDTREVGPLAYLLLVAGCAPLVVRRQRSLAVSVVVSIAAAGYALLNYPGGLSLPLALAAYSAARHEERRGVVMIALPACVIAAACIALQDGHANWVEVLSQAALIVGIPMILGRMGFNRMRRIEQERDRAALDAVSAERARIARELHDVVAHAMSVMVVQAGAARTVLANDPAQATESLRQIEETGRTGLQEMRRLIGVLKEESSDADLTPQPGLSDLEPLLTTVHRAGVLVHARVEGAPRVLPPGVDLTAYRLVQEALTNVIKHAGDGAQAFVVTRYRTDALDLEVTDDGHGPASNTLDGAGHGLIGMRERVAMFHGTLRTSERPGGGFVVQAHIPLDTDPSA